jgi:hypothetical protein
MVWPCRFQLAYRIRDPLGNRLPGFGGGAEPEVWTLMEAIASFQVIKMLHTLLSVVVRRDVPPIMS